MDTTSYNLLNIGPQTYMMYAGVIISILIIIILYYLYSYLFPSDNPIEGFGGMWIPDSNFLNETGANNILLYINNENAKNMQMCIVIDEDIYVFSADIEESKKSNGNYDTAEVSMKAVVREGTTPGWRENLDIKYIPIQGMVVIKSGDKLYGLFYKDHELTNYVCAEGFASN